MPAVRLKRGVDGGEVGFEAGDPADPVVGLQHLARLLASRPDHEKGVPGQLLGLGEIEAALRAAGLLWDELRGVQPSAWAGRVWRGRPAGTQVEPPGPAWFGPPPVEAKRADRFNGDRQQAWYVAMDPEILAAEVHQGGPPEPLWRQEFRMEASALLDLRVPQRSPHALLNAATTLASVPRHSFVNHEVQLLRLVRELLEHGSGFQGVVYPSIQKGAPDQPRFMCLAIWEQGLIDRTLAQPVGEPVRMEPAATDGIAAPALG